jgi:hypothetical protein
LLWVGYGFVIDLSWGSYGFVIDWLIIMKKFIFILKVLNFAIFVQLITAYIFVQNSNALGNNGTHTGGNNNISQSINIGSVLHLGTQKAARRKESNNINKIIVNRKNKNIYYYNGTKAHDSSYNNRTKAHDSNYIKKLKNNNNENKAFDSSDDVYNSNIYNNSIQTLNSSFLSQIKLFGTFAASYTYNFANPTANAEFPQGNYNGNYIDDYKVNGFTINELDITISKNAFLDGRHTFGIGFKATFDTGENIQDVGPYTGNYSYYTSSFYNRPLYGFRNLYISLGLPLGNGLEIDIGEKNYLIGFESYNLSRLWENTYSPITSIEPGELTGIFLSYPVIPRKLKMVFGTAMTDNAMTPIDRYPTFEFIASYKPLKDLKFHEGAVYGAENFIIYNNNLSQDNLNKFFYNFMDAKYKPFHFWTFVIDYETGLNGGINKSIAKNSGINVNNIDKFNYSGETTSAVYPNYLISTSNATYDKSRFSGLAFYIHHYNLLNNIGRFSQTIREVRVWDPQGMWEATSVPGEAFNYFDSTLTFSLRPSCSFFKNTQFRLEFENQLANHKVYGDGNSSQNTVNFMLVRTF